MCTEGYHQCLFNLSIFQRLGVYVLLFLCILDDYDAREAEIYNLPVDNPSWASATSALRELYDTQECITMRSAYQGPLQVPSSGPGGMYRIL